MIERLYPGVYLAEIPFDVKPIDGVPTSTRPFDARDAIDHAVHLAAEAAPDWTQVNSGDPGVTLLQLFAFLGEPPLSRADLILETRHHGGVVQGLGVDASVGLPALHVAPGMALGPDGQSVHYERATAPHVTKP